MTVSLGLPVFGSMSSLAQSFGEVIWHFSCPCTQIRMISPMIRRILMRRISQKTQYSLGKILSPPVLMQSKGCSVVDSRRDVLGLTFSGMSFASFRLLRAWEVAWDNLGAEPRDESVSSRVLLG